VASDCYEIRVKGRLNASLQAAFQDMKARVEPVETILSGPLEDQSALFGALLQVQALGLELIEVRNVAAAGAPSPASPDRESTSGVTESSAPAPPPRRHAAD
jgi:hypothetical protein